MRLILEEKDLIAILGKHFETNLDPESVYIRTEPFEVEVTGIPLPTEGRKNSAAPRTPVLAVDRDPVSGEEVVTRRADTDAFADPPPPGTDEFETTGDGDMHPAAVVARSRLIEQELDAQNPQLGKLRRGPSGTSKAPEDFQNEV